MNIFGLLCVIVIALVLLVHTVNVIRGTRAHMARAKRRAASTPDQEYTLKFTIIEE